MKFFVFLLLANISLISFSQQKKIDVIYIANCGFLFENNNKQLVIDALFKPVFLDYVAPPDSITTKIINGQKPFDKLHLLLVTHNHEDHFNDSMVVEYLNYNPMNILIAPSLVVNAILKHPDYKGNKDQIVELYKDNHYKKDTIIQGIRIQSFFLQHDNRPEIENVGYLIDMDGIKILHTGDCLGQDSLQIENLQLNNKNIDIALLGTYWLNEKERNIAKHKIAPKKIILMHCMIKYQEQIEQGVKEINEMNNFIDLTIFDKSMEKKSFVLK
jgi:L-ascorbate metabolism protein UlaG (beta-lactamase superfamily)